MLLWQNTAHLVVPVPVPSPVDLSFSVPGSRVPRKPGNLEALVRKDWNCPPIPEEKSEKTQNLSFSVWLLTRLFFLPSTDHKTLFCWSVPLGLPQASFLQNWREEKKFRVAEIRLQKPKKMLFRKRRHLRPPPVSSPKARGSAAARCPDECF